jgi:hypothetical protein
MNATRRNSNAREMSDTGLGASGQFKAIEGSERAL